MLSRSLLPIAIVAALASSAQAATTTGLNTPDRLTAGSSDQFLGVLDPAGKRFFYVSNENSTTQIFGADRVDRVPTLLFDEAADVTWPRVSPDGKTLLYISYRTNAAGDLCLRDLAAIGFGVANRRCSHIDGHTALQAAWMPDSQSILLLTRDESTGEIELRRVPASGGDGVVLLKRDLSSPAVSPDGRWLAYVPITRDLSVAGAGFTGRAGNALDLVDLRSPDAPPRVVRFDLPGKSGFPAFSPDGRYLYFSQYLNDTNFDGTIDGNDHSVLFRVLFQDGRIDPAGAEQLTSSNWDCQYPSPGRDRLITTCLFQGSLNVYLLPLDGAVPPSWNRARLLDELSASRSPWEQLLLLSRLSTIEMDPVRQASDLERVIELHLNLGEYESADFYADALQQLAHGRSDEQWREEEGIAQVMKEISGHRRAEQALSEGELSAEFLAREHARLDRLQPLHASPLPAVAALSALAGSEIEDTIGNKGEALALLESVKVDAHTRPVVLRAIGDRARDLYGPLNEQDRLLQTYLTLSSHPAFDEGERLAYAQDFVDELIRGRTPKEQEAALDQWRSKLDPNSDAAFVVELERALSTLSRDRQEPVRAAIFALYQKNRSFDRREALVHDTLQRAASTDSEMLRYQFADTWVSYVDRNRAERRRAEDIYRQSVMERAYVEWAHGKVSDARGHFFGVTLQTSSLESHVGYIEARLREGKFDVKAEYLKRYRGKPDDPMLRFALAYLIARQLPDVQDPSVHAKDAAEALDDLRVASRGIPNSVEINTLWGYVAHQRFLRTGDHLAALEANAHYLLALDLARDNPRYEASILSALSLLQSRVGNDQMALGFFEERQKLPFTDPKAELGHCLAWARSLLHSDREQEAASRADQCVRLIDETPSLQPYLPLALDRCALDHLVAGDFTQARSLYERLQPLVEHDSDLRNRFVAHLGRAAAALGANLPDETLSELDAADQLMPRVEPLHDAFQPNESLPGTLSSADARRQYEMLFAGLRAEALARKGDYAGATTQMTRRRDLYLQRLDKNVDDDRLQLALAESHLAEYAYRQGDMTKALAHVEAGLRWSDEYSKRTGTDVHPVGLALLRAYAQLHFDGKVPLSGMRMDLPARLGRMYALLCDRPNPDWLAMRERYGVYIDELIIEGVKVRL